MDKVQFHNDLNRLIEILPPRIVKALDINQMDDATELVFDLGREAFGRTDNTGGY